MSIQELRIKLCEIDSLKNSIFLCSIVYAVSRLAELKLAEKDRKNQENQLREQLLLAGIQDGPRIPYDVTVHKFGYW